MTDILDMLQKIVAQEFGTYDVRDDSVRIGCGHLREAIAEIQRLRQNEIWRERGMYILMPSDHLSIRPSMNEPKPDPWGSPFAMNTENWK